MISAFFIERRMCMVIYATDGIVTQKSEIKTEYTAARG
uniref:Uncharacterized protein n=1 Tax=virus sp. ctmTa7 TaxID=2828255 RepID=A0A8S5RC45_9VIRU|nr:MAG TPA: hypothetical protein [virus sp. ctmTa7]